MDTEKTSSILSLSPADLLETTASSMASLCVCVYVHIHLPLHYESSGRMDKCDIMTGRKCDSVARQSVKWIHILIEIS